MSMVWVAYFSKWLHLCLVMLLVGGLLGSYALGCVVVQSTDSVKRQQMMRLSRYADRTAWWAMLVLAITGTMLIYPRGYTFQTPWIDAAYLFLIVAGLFLSLSIKMKRRLIGGIANKPTLMLVGYHLVNAALLTTLVVIAYEAVSKTTFLF